MEAISADLLVVDFMCRLALSDTIPFAAAATVVASVAGNTAKAKHFEELCPWAALAQC